MLHAGFYPEFQKTICSHTTRPASGGLFGTIVTPSTLADTFGTAVEVLSAAAVTVDCYFIKIEINDGFTSGQINQTLVTLMKDEGSGDVDWISNLLCPAAAILGGGQGTGWTYYFPVFIRAGTQILAKAALGRAVGSPPTLGVRITLYGNPRHPEAVPISAYVDTFGADTATTAGTVIASIGTTNDDGAWTAIGSPLTKDYWWWQVGLGLEDGDIGTKNYAIDVSCGSVGGERVIITDHIIGHSLNEEIGNIPLVIGACAYVAAGEQMFVRVWNSGSIETGDLSIALYGVR